MALEAAEFRYTFAAADALLRAEPQVVVLWEKDQPLRLVMHSLKTTAGIPEEPAALLRFDDWMDMDSAEAFESSLHHLFTEGRAFSLVVKTHVGGYIEADGRTSGGRGVLRFRDMAGYRRELLAILDRHKRLSRDIGLSRAILDTLQCPVWLRDDDGRIGWCNAAYVKAVEAASADEAIEKQVELLESRQRQALGRAISRGQSYRKRIQLTTGGDKRQHDLVVIPMDGASAGAAIDVTAAETARSEVDRQIQTYGRALDRVATAVAIFSAEQKLTFFNDSYLKLWGLDAAWLASEPSDGAILDRMRDMGALPEMANYRDWKAKTLSCYKNGPKKENWWHLPDGRVLHVMGERRPDGGVTYLYVNETNRIALESRYNALINVQGETLNSLKEGIAVFTSDGRLELYNTAFAFVWQLSPEALAEKPHIDDIILRCGKLYENPVVWRDLSRAVTAFSEHRDFQDGQMLRSDQSIVDYTAVPLPDGAMILIFSDVTGTKHHEKALVERNEALVAAGRLKDQFIGHISYELRTPLTTIIELSDLLVTPEVGSLNAKQQDHLGGIATSSKTLLAMVDDILDLATIDAGVLELEFTQVDVREVIEAARRGLSDRVANASIGLDIRIAADVGDFVADAARVRQVLYNLLSNAVGFSKPGDTVRLAAHREHGQMIFSVADRGVGIPKDQKAHVFERFESRSQGSKHRGAGLGLSIVKSLVELHGGEVELESELGQGTRVTVRFPEGAAEQAAALRSALPSGSGHDGKGARKGTGKGKGAVA